MRFPLVIWDMDGTLVDSKRDIARSVNWMLERYGLPLLPLQTIETYVGSGAGKLVERSMGGAAGRFDIPEAVKLFRSHYIEHCMDTTAPFPLIPEILNLISDSGSKQALITNKPTNICLKMMEKSGLSGCFFTIVGADDVKRMKPDTEAAEMVLRAAGVGGGDTLMIGDSLIDVNFARAAGMKVLVVGYGGISPVEELESCGADWFCRTTRDLFEFFRK